MSWLDICPVCKEGKLSPNIQKKVFGLVSENVLECESCNAIFKPGKDGFKLSKVQDKSEITWQEYGNQTLTEREWTNIAQGGISDAKQRDLDIDKWLMNAKTGTIKFKEPDSPVILKKNERAVLVLSGISLLEPRAVRKTRGAYGGPTIRVAKGVSFRLGGVQATSESHEELRNIDQGVLTLTNKRLIFTGKKRTTNINLGKILAIEPYKDGIGSQRENKQKTEYFVGTNRFNLNISVDGRNYKLPIYGLVLKSIIEGLIKQL